MSWASFGDDFTSRPCWDGIDYATRWHYHAMVERCTRDRRWDGVLPRQAAMRCSDVPDPERCVSELVRIGMVNDDGPMVGIVYIEEHIPPEKARPDVLLPRKAANLRDYRLRKCQRGEHDRHCPVASCPEKGGKPPGKPVTPGTGTNRVGENPTPLVKEQHPPPDEAPEVDPWALSS